MTVPTVLVVDDDDDIRELTKTTLELTADWNVLTARGGTEAIAIAREHTPDAILLDMMMPDMDGLTTFDHLQTHDATHSIPVILFTAKVQLEDRQTWEGRAIRGAIAKPYDPMTLADEVSRLLSWTKVG